MTLGLASGVANSFLGLLRATAFTTPTNSSVGLHTADPAGAGTTAASVGNATKNAVTYNAPATGSMSMATLGSWTNAATTETISHLTIWHTGGATFWQSGALTVPQAWVATNTLTVTSLVLNLTPIAA